MRPRGEIRSAMAAVAAELGSSGATWRDMATRAGVGFDLARRTAENMRAVGELAAVGTVRAPGVCRPMVLYAPPLQVAAEAGAELDAVIRCWADFR